jgi:integrating conjugative element membrane protein (TIGR03745 family)
MNASATPRRTARSIGPRIAAAISVLALAAAPLPSFADLPTMEDPSRGTGSGIMQTLQNYGYDIVLLIALLVVASMFVGVCYHAYTRYSEIHTGRATWGQFGLTVGVGAILLVVGIWLLTKATGVL